MNKLYEKLAVAILNKYIPPAPEVKPAPAPKRDANGRVMPIRAWGESEMRGPDLSPLMPAPFVEQIFLHGSHHQRVAMKRALKLSAKNFYMLKTYYFMEGGCPFVYYSSALEQVTGRNDFAKRAKKLARREFREAMRNGTPYKAKPAQRIRLGWVHIGEQVTRDIRELDYQSATNRMSEDILNRNNDPETHRKMVEAIIKGEKQ